MKIAIVCFNLGWQSGGPRLIFSLAQGLTRAGHTVIIYAPEFAGEYFKELWKGLDIRVVPPNLAPIGGKPKNLVGRVRRKVREERVRSATARGIANVMDTDFNVVNLHDWAYPVGYFYKKRNPKAKVVWTENDPPYTYVPKANKAFDRLSRFYNRMKDITSRRYFRAIEDVAVLDSYNKKWCEDRGLRPTVIRLGVDANSFHLPVKDFKEKAAKKKIKIFSLGSLNKYRRYEDTIRGVKFLREWGYDATLKIIANDQWDERAYREKITGLIEEHDLKSAVNIQFTGVSEDGLREAYKESDVFVYAMYLPPPRNGFGFSIGVFEAMTGGLPLIVCRTTTSTEVLKDRETALFVDPMSPQQIAEKVKFLVDNPEQYAVIARKGQEFVEKNLTWEKYVSEMLALISLR